MASPADIDLGLHTYWYLGRAGGFVAFVLLLISLVLGVAISSRIFDGLLARAWFFELHKFVSLFLLGAVLFHALIMLPDPYAGYTVDELLVPFRSHIMPEATAFGILSLYGLALISLSFYLTKWIGQRAWRLLHYATFLTYGGGVVHALWAGTDSEVLGVRYFYLASAVALIFFVLYRILAARSQKKRPARPAMQEAARQVSGAV
jgi:sulfoxide reductase heme-binding subunit YedZ